MKQLAFVIPLLVGLLALGWFLSDRPNRPTTRTIAKTVPRTIFAAGRVEGATEQVQLRPGLHERIAEVLVEEGQQVAADQVLLRLVDDRLRHEVTRAAAELELENAKLARLQNGARSEERAEAESLYHAKQTELQHAETVLRRITSLRRDGAVTEQTADDQETRVASLLAQVRAAKARRDLVTAPARADDLRLAEASVQSARARFLLAETEWKQTELRAPSAGQIVAIHVRVGEFAGPDSPTPSLVLVNTRDLQVRAYVDEIDALRVAVGMSASITTDALPGRTIAGRTTRMSPRMCDKQLWTNSPTERIDTKTREIWIELEEKDGLIVGLPVDVTLAPLAEDTSDPADENRAETTHTQTPEHSMVLYRPS